MPEKGTLTHKATRWETWDGMGVRVGREKAFSVFLSGNIVFPCVN